MRDEIRNKNWKRLGFSEDLAARIGLHIQRVKILEQDGKIQNVVGKGVDETARIEPITEPNQVFCSELFYQYLLQEKHLKIKGVEVGKKKLAKNYGEMNLYQLMWRSEKVEEPIKPTEVGEVPIPRIRKQFTDKQKIDFLYQAFEVINDYFKRALKKLETVDPGIETTFREINDTTFTCDMYLNGQSKNRCKIWITGNSFSENGINYVEGNFDITSEDSAMILNNLVYVEDDGFEMYLKKFIMDWGNSSDNLSKDKATPEQAAKSFWKQFTHVLEY